MKKIETTEKKARLITAIAPAFGYILLMVGFWAFGYFNPIEKIVLFKKIQDAYWNLPTEMNVFLSSKWWSVLNVIFFSFLIIQFLKIEKKIVRKNLNQRTEYSQLNPFKNYYYGEAVMKPTLMIIGIIIGFFLSSFLKEGLLACPCLTSFSIPVLIGVFSFNRNIYPEFGEYEGGYGGRTFYRFRPIKLWHQCTIYNRVLKTKNIIFLWIGICLVLSFFIGVLVVPFFMIGLVVFFALIAVLSFFGHILFRISNT